MLIDTKSPDNDVVPDKMGGSDGQLSSHILVAFDTPGMKVSLICHVLYWSNGRAVEVDPKTCSKKKVCHDRVKVMKRRHQQLPKSICASGRPKILSFHYRSHGKVGIVI